MLKRIQYIFTHSITEELIVKYNSTTIDETLQLNNYVRYNGTEYIITNINIISDLTSVNKTFIVHVDEIDLSHLPI